MHKLKPYISVFFLALLLYPWLEKVHHELDHLEEEHCETRGLHFCAYEHTCEICDYVFSVSSDLNPGQPEFIQYASFLDQAETVLPGLIPVSPAYTHALRGPPAC
jgi:hypothetical protein